MVKTLIVKIFYNYHNLCYGTANTIRKHTLPLTIATFSYKINKIILFSPESKGLKTEQNDLRSNTFVAGNIFSAAYYLSPRYQKSAGRS